jgi:hypothetical protein
VERTEAAEVLRTRLAQLDVLAHDADDVSLLLDSIGETAGIGHRNSVSLARAICVTKWYQPVEILWEIADNCSGAWKSRCYYKIIRCKRLRNFDGLIRLKV